MVNTFHLPSSIFELMFVSVRVNEIDMKALVDTRATHSCVASNVATNLGLTIEAYDSIVTSLNDRDYSVEGVIRFNPLKMGEWVGSCDLIVMALAGF